MFLPLCAGEAALSCQQAQQTYKKKSKKNKIKNSLCWAGQPEGMVQNELHLE